MRFGGLNTVIDFHPTLLCLIHPQPSWWVLGAPLLEYLGSMAQSSWCLVSSAAGLGFCVLFGCVSYDLALCSSVFKSLCSICP